MKRFYALTLVALIAGCGADGAPEPPASMDATVSGVAVTGCATLGVTSGPTGKARGRC